MTRDTFDDYLGPATLAYEAELAARKTASPVDGLSSDEQKLNGKRWGKQHGFYGAQGGWVYTAAHKPVTQSWSHFFHLKRTQIAADVAAGTFTVTRSRRV